MNTIILAAAVAVGSWVLAPGGNWSLTPKQVSEIRSDLELFVKHRASEQKVELPSWSHYSFTYQGRMAGDGKFILISAFCTPLPDPDKEIIVVVADGGPCYFNVKYDVQKKRFFELIFNGIA
jgi:hypothetical protein